jgi:hypothetical protein
MPDFGAIPPKSADEPSAGESVGYALERAAHEA